MISGVAAKLRGRGLVPWAEGLYFTALFSWLLWAALVVQVEPFDGYDTLFNARHFLHQAPYFFELRAPALAWLMVPVEWFKIHFDVDAFDLRPEHLLMALVHGLALAAMYLGQIKLVGRHVSGLLAFATVSLSYAFISYLPFLSHDIIPGALLLWMLILAQQHMLQPRLKGLLLLLLLGALGPLIKHVFALFWVVVLVVSWLNNFALPTPIRLRRWALLIVAAGLSALVVWLGFAQAFAQNFSTTPWWLRPYIALKPVLGQFGTTYSATLWLYARNILAYGAAVVPLVALGIVLALWRRKNQNREAFLVLRSLALAVLIFALLMPLLELREVRYLLFLSALFPPLVALALTSSGPRWWPLWGGLALLQIFAWPWAVYPWPQTAQALARPARDFYQGQDLHRLRQALDSNAGPIAVYSPLRHPVISLMDDEALPIKGDIFHGIFHLADRHIELLLKRPVWVNQDPALVINKSQDTSIMTILTTEAAFRQARPPAYCLRHLSGLTTIVGPMFALHLDVEKAARHAPEILDQDEVNKGHARGSNPPIAVNTAGWQLLANDDAGAACLHLLPPPAQGDATFVPIAVAKDLATSRALHQDAQGCIVWDDKTAALSGPDGVVFFVLRQELMLRLRDQKWRQIEAASPELCPRESP